MALPADALQLWTDAKAPGPLEAVSPAGASGIYVPERLPVRIVIYAYTDESKSGNGELGAFGLPQS
ncbi:MAG: hypothetical protein DCC67_11010 [Planctomycetota bacterium]|nr:MAG: hypothetical protein DCC67_11010 [Planctomycetota bacterium]